MSANVETMFSVRETPWHGLGRVVMDAPASREALELAGLAGREPQYLFRHGCYDSRLSCQCPQHR